jgi:hypothetical protein
VSGTADGTRWGDSKPYSGKKDHLPITHRDDTRSLGDVKTDQAPKYSSGKTRRLVTDGIAAAWRKRKKRWRRNDKVNALGGNSEIF